MYPVHLDGFPFWSCCKIIMSGIGGQEGWSNLGFGRYWTATANYFLELVLQRQEGWSVLVVAGHVKCRNLI